MDIDDFYQLLSEEVKEFYIQLANAAMLLGYKPKRAKTQTINVVFINNKTKRHIMKFSIEKGKPVIKLKYYATNDYSNLFQEALRITIEEYDYKYTGCYQCGKCSGELEGYYYKYNDGRAYFRCGSELISLPPIDKEHIHEIIKLLQQQHKYYIENK